jgi:hypothetical protein
MSYFELRVVLNIPRGTLPVALNIVTCSVVGVLGGNKISVSMKVKEFVVYMSKYKLFKDDCLRWRNC